MLDTWTGEEMQVFISCVKSKKNHKTTAEKMYTSSLFKGSLAYAKKLTNRENIYILSAKYGVLRLDDEIYPYEKTLKTMTEKEKKKWAYMCYKQLTKMNVDFDKKTVFLCGKEYRKYLIQLFSDTEVPLKNMGLGKQLKFYKEKGYL